jgi:subtilisin family serine protease
VVKQRRRRNDRKVRIAILDTGINAENPEITKYMRQISFQEDFTGSSMGVTDRVGHGTNAAALIFKVAPKAELCIAKVVASREATDLTSKHIAEVCILAHFYQAAINPSPRQLDVLSTLGMWI